MKNQTMIFKKIILVIAAMALALSMKMELFAADFQATVSSATVTAGENVTVTVTFSSDVMIGAYAMSLSYQSDILEYISGADGGGGGTLQFYNDYVNNTSKSYTLTFKAKAAGSSKLSFQTISQPCDTDINDMTVKAGGGTITVEPPRSLSSDNKLTSLSVFMVHEDGSTEAAALKPAFSADVTEYQLSIPASVARLSLDAKASDSKATTKVSGTRMDPGKNSTTVTVTAEDGSVRKYVIYTQKEVEETTTPEETTTVPEETTTMPEETTVSPEETTVPQEEPAIPDITIDGKKHQIGNIPEDFAIPEGYELSSMDYQGNAVSVLQGLSTKLTLVYLMNAETQTGSLFVYEDEEFMPYQCVNLRQQTYTLLKMPKNSSLPFGKKIGEDFTEITLEIEGESVQALDFGAGEIFLVYAMNWNGESGWYFYDKKENTMLRYVSSELENEDSEHVFSDTSAFAQERKLFEQRIEKRNLMIYVLTGICAVLFLSVLVLAVKGKKHTRNKSTVFSLEEEEQLEQNWDSQEEKKWKEETKREHQTENRDENQDDNQEEDSFDEEGLDKAIDDILNRSE